MKDEVVLLDGGLATALEARGHDLRDELWSARLLIDAPEEIQQVHEDYLRAGAQIITTASYQASFEGFARLGIDAAGTEQLMRESVALASSARDNVLQSTASGTIQVAASVGPYGAVLADGSEYRGDYQAHPQALKAFHQRRFAVLAESDADLLAIETIPAAVEAEVLLSLLSAYPDRTAWLSFTCRDESHISDGTPIDAAAQMAADHPQVVALGVNCVDPLWVDSLIGQLCEVTDKPIIAYPNRGGRYDSEKKTWDEPPESPNWSDTVALWIAKGARWVGGCCGLGPDVIAQMRTGISQLRD